MKKSFSDLPFYNTATLPYHRAKAIIAATGQHFPARRLKVIGVTGTNGKTTTCFMIFNMLRSAGHHVGLLTTVAHGVNDDIILEAEHMTTASPALLNQRIKSIADRGVDFLVLEITSHALAQYRTTGIPIDLAVMTNVTHEHLDYHRTLERYRDAKRRLFKLANHNRKGKKTGIINADDPSSGLFVTDVTYPLTYGIHSGTLQARQISLLPSGVDYHVKTKKAKYHIRTQIPGEFNVYNSLAALAVGIIYKLTPEQIEKGIYSLNFVEGRMNRIDLGQNFDVLIDFAHTPDSFERLLSDLRRSVKNRIITVFGSAGRRDEAKRAVQGQIAGKYSDIVVATEEDDRDIDGHEILAQIASGAEKSGKVEGKTLFKILDRPSAIAFALKQAKKGDLVVFLGKGHEKTIERADGAHPWSETKEVKKALKKLLTKR